MIWAIRYKNNKGATQVKYTDPVDIAKYGIGGPLGGSITLGVAFLNGFKGLTGIDAVEVEEVDAIFLFTDGTEAFTNEADAANRKQKKFLSKQKARLCRAFCFDRNKKSEKMDIYTTIFSWYNENGESA